MGGRVVSWSVNIVRCDFFGVFGWEDLVVFSEMSFNPLPITSASRTVQVYGLMGGALVETREQEKTCGGNRSCLAHVWWIIVVDDALPYLHFVFNIYKIYMSHMYMYPCWFHPCQLDRVTQSFVSEIMLNEFVFLWKVREPPSRFRTSLPSWKDKIQAPDEPDRCGCVIASAFAFVSVPSINLLLKGVGPVLWK